MSTEHRLSSTRSTSRERIYATIGAVLMWLSLGLQFYLSIALSLDRGLSLWVGIARYFGYFTILTNFLVALAFTVPLVQPRSRWGRFFSHPSVRSAIALYIIVVGIAYSLLLRHIWNPQGWQLVADRMLHDVSPILYVVFWFLFVPKAALQWRDLPKWLIYPLVYLVVALIRGAIFNWYPYPFLEANKLGYPQVFLNVVMLFVGFCVVGAVLIGIARSFRSEKTLT
ncbi:Pr6Pr family membrane protein [Leptolyngbya sp. NIES-2104]|uniref:Pr6Pr family membrane protein n=1 Tax=Leptolyngbya sp. NIES-2104 TaxID=1552121 RepID=UPI0006EC5768|nr:Pr6Pr family membrane protein [Leptolyngbya sp. NIES-2104]GAP94581.1 integral membrane protein [Leptolyngbya sp. NIES-2104]